MEKYLTEQYDVFEDEKWLTNEEDIVDYFKDNGREYFECGQGYYQDEVSLICRVGDKFYDVTVSADIGSEWQDRGDNLYFVDEISGVKYKEINKPLPKNTLNITYELTITEEQKRRLESFMGSNYIKFG